MWFPKWSFDPQYLPSLEELLKVINKISKNNIKILEVWAGYWRLSYFLKKN